MFENLNINFFTLSRPFSVQTLIPTSLISSFRSSTFLSTRLDSVIEERRGTEVDIVPDLCWCGWSTFVPLPVDLSYVFERKPSYVTKCLWSVTMGVELRIGYLCSNYTKMIGIFHSHFDLFLVSHLLLTQSIKDYGH